MASSSRMRPIRPGRAFGGAASASSSSASIRAGVVAALAIIERATVSASVSSTGGAGHSVAATAGDAVALAA